MYVIIKGNMTSANCPYFNSHGKLRREQYAIHKQHTFCILSAYQYSLITECQMIVACARYYVALYAAAMVSNIESSGRR